MKLITKDGRRVRATLRDLSVTEAARVLIAHKSDLAPRWYARSVPSVPESQKSCEQPSGSRGLAKRLATRYSQGTPDSIQRSRGGSRQG